MADRWEERLRSYPGRSRHSPKGNLGSDAKVGGEESAEVIVPVKPGRTEHEAAEPLRISDRTEIVENEAERENRTGGNGKEPGST